MNTSHTKRNIVIKRSRTFGLVTLALTLALGPPVAFGQFDGWSPIPTGTLSSGPAVFVPGANGKDADVYARGMDNAIWYIYYREFLGRLVGLGIPGRGVHLKAISDQLAAKWYPLHHGRQRDGQFYLD